MTSQWVRVERQLSFRVMQSIPLRSHPLDLRAERSEIFMQRRRRDDCPTKWRVCKGRNLQLSENLSSTEVLELDDQNQKNPEQSLEAFDVLKQDSQQSLTTCTAHNFAILQHLQHLHYNSFGKRKKKQKNKTQTANQGKATVLWNCLMSEHTT